MVGGSHNGTGNVYTQGGKKDNMVSYLFQHSQWTLLRSRRGRDMRRDRMVQEHTRCASKTSNIAKGHPIAPRPCNHRTGLYVILKGTQT